MGSLSDDNEPIFELVDDNEATGDENEVEANEASADNEEAE